MSVRVFVLVMEIITRKCFSVSKYFKRQSKKDQIANVFYIKKNSLKFDNQF